MPVTREPIRSSTPSFSSAFAARAESRSPNVARGSVPPSMRRTRTVAGSKVRKSRSQAAHRELADLARELDAGRSGADHRRSSTTPAARSGSVVDLGHLERAEDPPAQLERVVDRLHGRREERELVVTEVRLVHAGGHDEAVVRHLDRIVQAGSARTRPGARGRTRSPRPARRVMFWYAVQHLTQRRRDLARGEDSGRHVVQQRLEQVMVSPVEQDTSTGILPRNRHAGRPPKPPPRRRRDVVARLRRALGDVDGVDPPGLRARSAGVEHRTVRDDIGFTRGG